jgi:hypothetical protein
MKGNDSSRRRFRKPARHFSWWGGHSCLPSRTYRPVLEWLEPRLAPANVDLLSYHNDLSLSGANLSETTLTTANVNPTQFGKLFSQPVDGYVYAEPLYKANLDIPGQGTHNVAFVATEHDSVYAFDADTPNAGTGPEGSLWKTSFLNPANGITSIPSPSAISNSDIVPEIGITGTPVIDGSSSTLYVVAATSEVRSGVTHYVQKLHALDITTGAEKFGGPYMLGDTVFGGPDGGFTNVSPDITVNGVGDGAGPDGIIRFNAARENNRAALQLVNGVVYAAFASHSDFRPYTGWVLGFNAQTLQPVKVFNTSPNSGGSGMWQSGGAVSADAQGNLYFAVGNGFPGPQGQDAFNPTLGNWSESVLKLSTTGQLTVADYFTPFEWRTLDSRDADLGSGGVMLLPGSVGSATHSHLMVELGKSGKLYLLDRDNMGQNVAPPGPDNVVQVVTAGQAGVWGNPTFFQVNPTTGIIYYHGSGDVMRGYTITDGHIDDTHVMLSPQSTFSNFPGTQPVISANGIANPTNPTDGIVWELQVDNFGGGTPSGTRPLTGAAFLRAYDATNLNNVLYDSGPIGQRDLFGDPIKFTAPTVTNGHVLVGEALTFSVFGLFPAVTGVPGAPSNLAGVPVSTLQGPQIQLTWNNPNPNPDTNPTGIKIFRSTDGTNFSLYDTVFRTRTSYNDVNPLPGQRYYYKVVATNQQGDSPDSNTVNLIAPIAASALTVTGAGASSIGLSWTLVANDHYDIERSTNGVDFSVVATVAGFQTTYTDTGLAAGQYSYRIHAFNTNPTADSFSNVQGAWVGPTIDHGNGFTNATDLTANGNTFVSATEQLVRLTNATSQTGSIFSNTRVQVGNFTTSFAVRLHEGTQPNYADGFTFDLQANSPTALGTGTAGIGYRGIGNSVALVFSTFQHTGDPSSSWVGLSLNGAAPATRVDTTTSGLLLNSQDIKQIDLIYDGTTLGVRIQDVVQPELVFTTSFVVNLAQVMGSDTAYVGFTGASGTNGFWQLEDIANWTFTAQASVPGSPTNLRVSSSTSTALSLAWNSNSFNETGFQLERSLDGKNFTLIATTTATTFEDLGLLDAVYYYRVRAFNIQGFSPYSATFTASLPGAALTQDRDVGTLNDPAIPGSFTFSNGTYAVTATGGDIWIPADRFHYVYQPLLGDGEIIARVVSIGRSDFYTKAGVMIRETLAADSKEAFMLEYPPPDHNEPTLNYRNQSAGTSVELFGPTLPAAQMLWVRLVRSGNVFTGYYSLDTGGGTHGPWLQVGTQQTIPMNPGVYVGLALTSHNNGVPSTTTFDNVQINPGTVQPTHLDVSSASGAVSPGAPVSVTVKALDRFNNLVSGYTGTVHFTTSDSQATPPADYTFTAADNGVHTFTVILPSTGLQSITVTDTATSAIAGSTVVTVTNDAIASSLTVSGFPTRILVGMPASFTLTARDAQGNPLMGYRGTVYLLSSDPLAQMLISYTFTSDDNGVHTFAATLNSLGMQSITATDLTDRVRGAESGILVVPPAPVVSAGAPITPTEGKIFDAATAFDGTGGRNDYVQVPSTLVVGGAITIEAWVKNTAVLTPWARIIDFANGQNNDNIIFGWNGNNPGHLYFETYRNGQTIMLVTPSVFPQSQWVHVAAVNDGNGMGSIYINGVLAASGPQMIPANVTRMFNYIGRSNYPDPFFQGSMQEVQIWRTTRSATQIQSDMNGLTGTETGLAAYYPMDEGSGTTIFDRTANHYDGTFTSTLTGRVPVWVGDSSPLPGRVVATFTSPNNPAARASDFTAMITWGDGHTSSGAISANGQGGFNVTGSNTYLEEGTFPRSVVVTDAFMSTGMAAGTVNVIDPAVAPTGGFNVLAVAGVTSRMQTVATFTDPGGFEALANYTAMVEWGDNTSPTVGTITFDAGTGVFTVQGSHGYDQAGGYPITVTIHHDAAADVTAASAAQVSPLVLHFLVAGFPSPTTAGNTGHFTVTALDQLDELVSNYGGTVHFTSSDPRAVLPADVTLTDGTGTFTATLKTAGTQTITATDTTNSSLTATQSVVVNPAAASYLAVAGYPSPTVKGQAHDFTVTAYDAYGNVATGYTGTVYFASDEGHAALPADYTFTAADAGAHTFSATFNRFGTFYLSAIDTANATITGEEDDILVVNHGGGGD